MDGVLIIDKPAGLTSHDVVNRVRRTLKTKRVGHTGTLDPFATGVLVLVVGRATRLAQFLDKDEKQYEAVIRFGSETDTGDLTGSPTFESQLDGEGLIWVIRETDWEEVLAPFRGEIEQIPPMYSAKKQSGVKLYEHARRGEEVARRPVPIKIADLHLTSDIPASVTEPELHVGITCSAGTYIRKLAEDIGRLVGAGAHLRELRRTRAGRFDLSRSIGLEVFSQSADPAAFLLPVDEAVAHLARCVLPETRIEKTRSGLSSRVGEDFPEGTVLAMLDHSGRLLAVGLYDSAEKSVQPKVVLI